MHPARKLALIPALAALIVTAALAQPESPGGYHLSWSTLDSGGGTSSGGAFQLTGAIGQPDAGLNLLSGGAFSISGGFWPGASPIANPCPPDIAPPGGDGLVNVDDLLAVITGWGPCTAPCPPTCNPDIAPPGGNCVVNVDDLLAIIIGWGACP